MIQPYLHLCALGFSPAEFARLEVQISRLNVYGFAWRLGHSADADLLLVNGASAHCGETDCSQAQYIVTQDAQGEDIRFDLSDQPTPLALMLPAPQPMRHLPLLMVGKSHGGEDIATILKLVAQGLRYERVLYRLGEGLVAQQTLPTAGAEEARVFHVYYHNELCALLNLEQDELCFSTHCDSLHAAEWSWHKRPASATQTPQDFMCVTVQEALWEYAMRAPMPSLPERYTQVGMRLAHEPHVRESMRHARHAPLLAALRTRGHTTLDELLAAPGIDGPNLERDLWALYLCNAIHATPPRSPRSIPSWLSSLQSWVRGRGGTLRAERTPLGRDVRPGNISGLQQPNKGMEPAEFQDSHEDSQL